MAKVLSSSVLTVLYLCYFSCILNSADAHSLLGASHHTQDQSKSQKDQLPTHSRGALVSIDTVDKNETLTLQNSHHYGSPPINTSTKILFDEIDDFLDSKLPPEDVAAEDKVAPVKTIYSGYYNGTIYSDPEKGKFYWVDMDKQKGVVVDEDLSNAHAAAVIVKLSFLFPFYLYNKENVTVTTGGFIFTGNASDVTDLKGSQYIAPLMANFDTNLSNESLVRYVDNGTAFTVEWERVRLQDEPTGESGEFTFQATLHKSGDIIFVYKNIPIPIENIPEDAHPVRAGLSDAYVVGVMFHPLSNNNMPVNVYEEYDNVFVHKEDIKNWTTIYWKPLRTCLSTDCRSVIRRVHLNLDIPKNDMTPTPPSPHSFEQSPFIAVGVPEQQQNLTIVNDLHKGDAPVNATEKASSKEADSGKDKSAVSTTRLHQTVPH